MTEIIKKACEEAEGYSKAGVVSLLNNAKKKLRTSLGANLFILSLLRVIILQCQCTAFQAGPHLDVLQYLQ